MSTPPPESIHTERRGPLLIVTIDRPQARNAFDSAASLQMNAAMDLLEQDPALFVGIITGSSGTFCAGADLKEAASGAPRARPPRGGFGIFASPPGKPLLAAVEGHAVGGGFELCLSCDLIVAASNARFGLPEVRHNVVAIGGGLFRLPRRMPYHLAMELALTGELYEAELLQRHGVVNRVVAPGTALEHTLQLAETLLRNGPTALNATKQIMQHAGEWTEAQAWQQQMDYARQALESEDRQEGLRAFAEKRRPVWKGK